MQCERPARHALLARLPGALVVLDAGGVISWADESAAALLGWPAADLVGQPVGVLLPAWPVRHPEPGAAAPDGSSASQPEPPGAVQWSARRRDGHELPVVVVAGPAPDQGRCLLINRVAGERPPAGAAPHVGAAAHELGNLIGVILNYATLLARSLADQPALADVGQIQTAARRGSELVRDLADGAEGADR